MAEDRRDRVQADLRKAGIRATKLFAPCSQKFSLTTDNDSAASVFSAQVVNLEWPESRNESEFIATVARALRPKAA